MKHLNLVLITLLVSVTFIAKGQVWELTSHQLTDMQTKAQMNIDAVITIDSSHFVISMNQQNFYCDISERTKDGDNYVYRALDKNDYNVLAIFNPKLKFFDYTNQDGSLRYVLDKVSIVTPPLSPEEQAKQDSIKQAITDSLRSEGIEDSTVYDAAEIEIPAEYPGGKSEMMSYLAKNVRYPKSAKEKNIQGFVTVTAIVEKDGTLSNVVAAKDIGGGCGAEAVRVVKSMPAWSPAENKGENVRMSISISVNFMK